jgi:type II secretory pathway pseudopilin PulG
MHFQNIHKMFTKILTHRKLTTAKGISEKNKGFTLVETLIYVIIVVLLIGAIAGFLYYTISWYRAVAIPSRVNQVGTVIMGQIESAIRSGKIINTGQSILGSNNGALSINMLTSTTTTIDRRYFISNNRVAYMDNTGEIQYISPTDVKIADLYFDYLVSPVSSALHFIIDIPYLTKSGPATSTFSGFTTLRNSYQ